MINVIKNKFLSVAVKNHGAELSSVKSLRTNKEYIWQADKRFWNKQSPVLFPIIGFLKDNKYEYNNDIYTLRKHGFARNLEFQLVEKHKDKLVYCLSYNKDTLKNYPFKFQLYIIYSLEDEKLSVNYEVKNIDNKDMYFSIGAHPAFNCNMEDGQHYIKFHQEEKLNTLVLNESNGLLEHSTNSILKNNNILPLSYNLFNQDTLIFKNIKSKYLCIMDSKSNENLKINFKDFSYLAFWSPKAPFICIEPWCGIPDFVDSNNKLEEKVGIKKLNSKETYKCNYTIEII